MSKKKGKRYRAWIEKIPAGKVATREAVDVLKGFDSPKLDPTIELTMHLGIDPRQADQALRGSISLPHGIGKTRKVIAFCDGDDVAKAIDAGAIEAGVEDLVKKIQDGWMDFDVAVAMGKVMKDVAKLGRLLGPQGKMPSPKAGTVVQDIVQAVKDYGAGKVEYRNDDGGNLHIPVGKASFEPEKLVENIDMFVKFIKKARPASTKGVYIKKATLSATMSPAVELEVG